MPKPTKAVEPRAEASPPAQQLPKGPSWLLPSTDVDRWRSAMLARAVVLVVGVVGLVAHSVAPGAIKLDAASLTLFGIVVLVALAPVLKDFKFPGGGGGTFVDGVHEAAAALERSEADRGAEQVLEGTAVEVEDLGADDDLRDVEQLASHMPREALLALRREMGDRLRALDRALVGGRPPASDYEVVRRLVKNGVIDQELAAAAYAVLGATEKGARERDVPVEAVQELIDIADRLLRDVRASAAPELQFESHVGDVLSEMAGRERVIRDPSQNADFRVGNTLVEVKHLRPGGAAPDVVAGRAARRLAQRLRPGMHGVVVLNDETDLTRDTVEGVLVTRLKELRPEDLG